MPKLAKKRKETGTDDDPSANPTWQTALAWVHDLGDLPNQMVKIVWSVAFPMGIVVHDFARDLACPLSIASE